MSVVVTSSLVITGSTFVGAGIVTDGLDFYLDPGNINSLLNPNFTTTTPINNLTNGAYSSSTYIPGLFSISTSSVTNTSFNSQYGGCLYVSSSAASNINAPFITSSVNTIDSQYLAGISEVTLGMWYYPLPQPNITYSRIGNLFNGGYNVNTDKKIAAWINDTGTTSVTFYTTATVSSLTTLGPALQLNKWNYITLIFNQGTAIAYTNGIPGTQITGGGLTLRSTNWASTAQRTFFIGGKSGGPNSGAMLGYMGPVQIYGRALTQQEVLQNYHTMKGRFGIYD
jgi:hypothetical protein